VRVDGHPLTPRGTLSLLAALLLLLSPALAGCPVSGASVVRLAEPADVAVAYVIDLDDRVEPVMAPGALDRRMARELSARNLIPVTVDDDALLSDFGRLRTTQQRVEHLLGLAGDAPWVLLVESRASFFSHLQGRYRWDVRARITLVPRGEPERAVSSGLSTGAFLLFEHEREREAVGSVARVIADESAELLDRALGAWGGPAAASPAPGASLDAGPAPVRDAIYFVMVDRFANGDPANDADADPSDPAAFFGGDLRGLHQRLDHLEALGVGAVWLSPIFAMRTEPLHGHGAFHGYWVEDLGRLEPRFGDEAELMRLRHALEARGIGLYLDMVLNHVGYDAPLTRERPEWFHRRGDIVDWSDPHQLETHDVHGLPDLDQSRPDVFEHLVDHSRRWIERLRPVGFRLDAVKHIGIDFWARYNDAMRAAAGGDFDLLGEALDGDPAVIARYAHEGGFSSLFDFPYHFALVDVFCRDRDVRHLGAVLSLDRMYPETLRLVTLLDNHDLPRVLTACRGEVDRVVAAVELMVASRGVPSFTWGTEIGLEGADEPDNRAPMRFGERHAVGDAMRAALGRRARSEALRGGATWFALAEDGLLAFVRWTPEDAALVIANRRGGAVAVATPPWLAEASGDARAVEVPASSTRVVRHRPRPGARFAPPERGGVVRVVARVAGVDLGDEVRVVGAGPELGHWRPAEAPRAEARDGGEAGIREATLTLPRGLLYELKLVRVDASGEATWEPGVNRILFIDHDAEDHAIELRWREA